MSDLSRRIANLSPAKRILLERKLQAHRATPLPEAIVPRNHAGPVPLSFAQQRLWLLEQLEGELVAYNIPFAMRLSGPLDVEALRRALETIIQRHEPLRTIFRLQEGEPAQVILPPSPFELPLIDLGDVPSDQREAALLVLRRNEGAGPFDLSADLMLRASLVRLAREKHIFLLTLHHIAVDGWSIRLLWRELATAYAAYRRNETPALDELAIQYADYAVWQRERLQGERLQAELDYWRKQLAGLEPLELSTDRPRTPRASYQGARHEFEVPRPLMDQLRQLSQREGATLHMTLLAAFQTLLARHSGQEDFAVGLPIAGRQHAELEPLIGFFVNTLVVRTDLSGQPTFRELLGRVRRVSLEAYDHQDLPFEKLVEELNPERHLGRNPLFQVMFQLLESAGGDELALPDLDVSRLTSVSERVRFDLEMHLRMQSEGNLRGTVVYSTDLFNVATIDRLVGHFQKLLDGIVADPDQKIAALPLLAEAERHRLLIEWNDTRREYPRDKCVHQLFEEQVARTPEAVAVVFENQHLTYRELNARSNQLAHYLRDLGVGPEMLVGICLERSLEMVVGLLGILKAGGAYVPLDPEYPAERLAFLLRDSAAPVLLTQKHLLPSLPDCSARVICLDADASTFADMSEANPPPLATPDNLAYVIYTSGSTGVPKGVLVSHDNVVRLFRATQPWFEFDRHDVWTLFHSFAFDFSVWEIWGALLHGSRLVVVPSAVTRSPRDFYQLLLDERVTVLNQTPSAFRPLIAADQASRSAGELCLRLVIFGGEALELASLRPWFLNHGDQKHQLVNMYGITETTVHVTYRPLRMADLDDAPGSVIGRPIPDLRLYVLESNGQPAPTGVPGEICVGGAGVARGYLNRPELTAQKFVPDPFGGQPDARLYRSGDLARYLPDGDIQYLGRIDQQVKIRGYRIELGEIEAMLLQHPSVQEAVVLAREDQPGDKRLAAYLVPGGGNPIIPSELRAFLKQRLPEYMIPSVFVLLYALPLTPNGKVDRRALPAPDQDRPDLATGYVPPRDAVEEQLAAIWAEVLGLERVGIHDNFFELGGHSLLATRVIARANSVLDVDLALRRMFETPTIAALAAEISVQRAAVSDRAGTRLVRVPRDDRRPIPLSFAQQRLWLLEQLEGELVAYNIPFAARLSGPLDAESLRRALETIVHRHEPLRTTFRLQDGEPLQVIQPPSRFDLPLVDLGDLPHDQHEAAVCKRRRDEAARPFDLNADPMLRASLVRLAGEEHVLLLTLHHIAADGWSIRLLWRELEVAYAAYRRNEAPALGELPIQYADYAVWQRNELQKERLERLLVYWRKQLAGLEPLELPTDRPRPPRASYQGARHDFDVPRALVDQLRRLSRREGTTLNMTLLAAFQTLLARYSGQEDIAVGLPIAGRQHTELEPLIGFFVNTLVLRTDLSGQPTFRELLGRVRRVSLEAYDYQELPFEKLVEELNPERHLSRNPLFQVVFQLLEYAGDELALLDLEASPLASVSDRVRFDLEIYLRAQPAGALTGTIVYSTDLFDAATIERLVGHFQTLLNAIVADPDTTIGHLPLLTDAERRQLSVDWNETRRDYPRDKCVHQLFEEQAARTPDAVALVFENQRLTYNELNARSNQLAHYLRDLGVGPEMLVGICLERSLEMIVGLLGILKAGAAYVPLDPDYPAERLGFLLQDSAVSVLLTQQRLLPSLPDGPARVLCLDADKSPFADMSDTNPSPLATPDNLAYVIYTSGSTGVPKGVLVSHDNVVRLFRATQPWFNFDRHDVWTLFHSFAFDFSVWEIWGALLHGGRLVVVPFAVTRSPGEFHRLLLEQRVTVLNQTPSAFRPLIAAIHAVQGGGELCLRLVIFGGEALELESLRPWFLSHGDQKPQLVNMYGITETTVHVTYRPLRLADLDNAAGSVIGCPIPDLRLYVLESNGQPAPPGVPGEIYVGGAGVARGYLNRPELTAQKFIPDPFRGRPEERLYRSGDLARYRPDGDIQYLGRLDDQVKIRGYRIELGEIEAILRQHPSVQEAIVVAREYQPGDKRLAAYLVPGGGNPIIPSELRAFVKHRLPEYMVPSAFVVLDALPLTPNGKVDRRALPAPDQDRSDLATGYVPPRDAVEEQLAAIWFEVLGLERVGIHDNFFELGGHSLLATQVIARANSVLDVDLALRRLFETPTIAGLAAEIGVQRAAIGDRAGTRLARIPRDDRRPIPLSFAQQRLWLLEQLERELVAYNMTFAARLSGPLDAESLRRALETIIHRHEPLRTTFRLQDGEPLQVIQPPSSFDLPLVDLGELPPDQREAALCTRRRDEAARPFDLNADPMLRASLVRLAGEEHILLLTLHHIAVDGWSIRLLWRELEAAYAAFRRNEAPALGELTIQYADYALWQRERLKGERLQAELDYWRKQLAGLEPLELPTDRPRPLRASYQGARHDFEVPRPLMDQLRRLSRRERATLNMTLLAAFQTLLARYSGQEDIAVGLPIAGRQHAELEPLIGFFVNTLVLRTDLSGQPTFRELLGRVRRVSLEAYDHQNLPFEKLVEELNPERHLGRNPLFQVMFQLLESAADELALKDLEVSPLASVSDRVRFDLEMHLRTQSEGSLRGTVVYSTDLFDAATASRIVGHFLTLLRGATADPGRPLSELPLLTDDEHRALATWNKRTTEYPRDRSLVDLFDERVELAPEAPALEDGEVVLSYRELGRRSECLAAQLRRAGVRAGAAVGLRLERSADAVVGLLAILRIGAAYVPIDPQYPERRQAWLLRDFKAPALVTRRGAGTRVPPGFAGTVIEIDGDLPDCGQDGARDDGPSESVSSAAAPAYVIYTSGSTGEPKGVVVSHRAIVRLVLGTDYVQLGPSDRVAQASTLAFDASTFEIWGALLNGATLVIIPRETVLSPRALAAALGSARITTLFLTTALFHQVARALPEAFRGLRHVLTGGEVLDPAAARAVLASGGPPQRLLNVYGPTESTTFATWHAIQSDDVAEGAPPLPIGRPIANTRAYVLDAHRRPVPVGIPGELWLGGDGLALGYLHQPALSAERFVPDPLGDGLEARLYRTGDLVRHRGDGSIEFLGRLDDQVKLRGFRIEPAEVEAALRRRPGVAEAAVVAIPDGAGGSRLVAYVVPNGVPGPPASLREALSDELPAFLVPAEYRSIDAIPLTAGGKIDRRALVARGTSPVVSAVSKPGPSDETEAVLVELWRELFPGRAIGVEDDFFALGGHSLLAVRLFALLELRFGSAPPLTTLLQGSTLRQLATAIRRQSRPASTSQLIAINPAGNVEAQAPPFVCFPGGGAHGGGMRLGHGLSIAALARLVGPAFPFYGVSLGDLPASQDPADLLPAIAERFLPDLRAVLPRGPYHLGGYSLGGLVALEVARRLVADGERVDLLALLDVYGPNYPKRRKGAEWLSAHAVNLRDLSAIGKLHYVSEKLRTKLRSRGARRSRAFNPALRSSYEEYIQSLARYPGKITLLRAANQPKGVRFAHLDPTMGWGALAEIGVEVISVPGDHLTMLEPVNLTHVANALRACLHGVAARHEQCKDADFRA